MKLHEKILYCRKRAGLSQEELAGRVGVSRQAVSKWETAEAVPETGKLAALAAALGVSVDWLLSEEEPERPQYEYGHAQETGDTGAAEGGEAGGSGAGHDWTETLPKLLRQAARRWGWLAGVYLAVSGLPLMLIGGLAGYASRRMLSGFENVSQGMLGSYGGYVEIDGVRIPMESIEGLDVWGQSGAGELIRSNPVAILGDALLVIGLVMLIAGVILAVVLRRRQAARGGDS